MSREMLDQGTVSKLVALMEGRMGKAMPARRPDLRAVRPASAQERATEAWRWHEDNLPPVGYMDVDQAPRARNIREINRIAMRHGWGSAVSAAIDRANATSLQAMTDPDIDALACHMRQLVDCAESGCDPYDDLPAR